ncbi:MAG: ADP-glyceromanno-heptose 6-epimerase [Planctomycetota bacterium]|jgi:ADP-L-glycero-D-manno-heptose 6-epimerase|nr:ADP-glyceromanno-heptose 6-epimerase [Planctomycetota bacterium]
MHIVTGGAGFIGSAMVWKLNRMGIDDVWIVDDLGSGPKWKNISGLKFREVMPSNSFLNLLHQGKALPSGTESVIHMGACSSTTETDAEYLLRNNFEFSRYLAMLGIEAGARTLVASSAATYGGGEHGYRDGVELLYRLRPLNMYGYSKLLFDQWAASSGALGRIASLRFFNVYGPNEYHKGDMASLVFKAYGQIGATSRMGLFKSHRPDCGHGEQVRDFVYVKDIVDAMWWLLGHPEANGLFNVGSGRSESWNELARSVFAAMGREPAIDYIDMPLSIRGQYQYRTEADIARLRAAGYEGGFRPLREGVLDYVQNHLAKANPHINNADS